MRKEPHPASKKVDVVLLLLNVAKEPHHSVLEVQLNL